MAAGRITNPKKRIITINGSGGAVVAISASKFARYIEIQECPPGGGAAATFTGGNFAAQGMNYQQPDDGFTNWLGLAPGAVLALGDNNWRRDVGFGVPVRTDPAGNSIAATIYGKFISATVTGTQVEVREFN